MNALVTGGGGFLGGAIVHKLLARGDHVRSFSRKSYPHLAALGVEQQQGNLSDAEAVAAAVQDVDIVFHVAAKAGIWGAYDDYYETNVAGTENVLAACKRHRVRRLVYTSSPSVVYDAKDEEGIDESTPYPKRYLAFYPKTKALAEQAILRANGPELATVSLRPHLIWGPGDPHLLPRIIAKAKAGELRRLGPRDKLVDTTYVDNAAEAHVLAADRLHANSVIAGRAYFVSQGEPIPLWEMINRLLQTAGEPPVTKAVPVVMAYAAGWIFEGLYTVLGRMDEPPMTRFLARQLSTSHWFNLQAARRDLGYSPAVSLEEGLRRLEL